jgi:hypothetical protein
MPNIANPNIKKIWNSYRFIREIRQRPTHKDYAWASRLPLEWPTYRSFETYVLANCGTPPTPKHKLCRRDRDQGWIADNLEWRSPKDLARTQRTTIKKTYQKRTRMISEWSEASGIPYCTVLGRIHRGWPIKLAITIPSDQRFNVQARKSAKTINIPIAGDHNANT